MNIGSDLKKRYRDGQITSITHCTHCKDCGEIFCNVYH